MNPPAPPRDAVAQVKDQVQFQDQEPHLIIDLRDGVQPTATPAWQRGYSAERDVKARLAAREAERTWVDRYLRASATSFGLVGRLLATLPVLVIPALMVVFGLWTNLGAVALLLLGSGATIGYLKSVWSPAQ